MESNRIDEQEPDNSDTLRQMRRVLIWSITPPVVMVLLRGTIFGGTDLLTQIPQAIQWFGYLIGTIIGCIVAWLVWSIKDRTGDVTFKDTFGAIAIVAIAILITSELTRWAFEISAFMPASDKIHQQDLKITNVSSGKSGTQMILKLSSDTREIWVPLTYERYLELRDMRPPLWSLSYFEEPYCVSLPVEKGHWGAMRAYVPKLWETGLSAYHACASEPPIM